MWTAAVYRGSLAGAAHRATMSAPDRNWNSSLVIATADATGPRIMMAISSSRTDISSPLIDASRPRAPACLRLVAPCIPEVAAQGVDFGPIATPSAPCASIRPAAATPGRSRMGTFRLYTGPDGQGRIETIDIEKKTDWLKGLPTTQISFSVWPVGRFLDWHPAPRRQFGVILSGQLEIGLGDGSKHVFGPGDARLVEDTTGNGHTTRVLGNQICVTATVPLA